MSMAAAAEPSQAARQRAGDVAADRPRAWRNHQLPMRIAAPLQPDPRML